MNGINRQEVLYKKKRRKRDFDHIHMICFGRRKRNSSPSRFPFFFSFFFSGCPEELKTPIQSQEKGMKFSTCTLPDGLQTVIDRQQKEMNLLTKIKSLKAVVDPLCIIINQREESYPFIQDLLSLMNMIKE